MDTSQDTATSSNIQITANPHNQHENHTTSKSHDTPAHEIPVPDLATDDELVCDLLTCTDVEDQSHLQGDENLAWRCEVSIDNGLLQGPKTEQDVESFVFLATAAKKQRTEVKLSQLTETERNLNRQKSRRLPAGLAQAQFAEFCETNSHKSKF